MTLSFPILEKEKTKETCLDLNFDVKNSGFLRKIFTELSNEQEKIDKVSYLIILYFIDKKELEN